MKIPFNSIYLNLIKHLIKANPNTDPDSYSIDYSDSHPNQITLDSNTITMGQFLDSLFHCLATLDIDPKTYSITEDHHFINDSLPMELAIIYKITINSIH